MTFSKIQELVYYMPMDWDYVSRLERLPSGLAKEVDNDLSMYLRSYSDLKFGFNFVRSMVQHGRRLPPILDPSEEHLNRAYYAMHGSRDSLVETAIAIGTQPSEISIKLFLEGCLLWVCGSKNKHARDAVAAEAGIDVETLKMYETLFFNVRDRMADEKFFCRVLYPQTRLEELAPDYAQTITIDRVVHRAAMKHGIKDLKYMIGSNDIEGVSGHVKEYAEKLEATIMHLGLTLAQNGFAHSNNIPMITAAKALIAAAKAGGQETTDEDPVSSAGDILFHQMQEASKHRLSANVVDFAAGF